MNPSAEGIVWMLRAQNIHLRVEAGTDGEHRLIIDAPRGKLSVDVTRVLRRRKAELITYLRRISEADSGRSMAAQDRDG